MPLTRDARTGLKAAVDWNPDGARLLLGILRETPEWVAYKDDEYGPIHLIFNSHISRRGPDRFPADQVTPPFPRDQLTYCRTFDAEWNLRRFTKRELAAAIEELLARSPEPGSDMLW